MTGAGPKRFGADAFDDNDVDAEAGDLQAKEGGTRRRSVDNALRYLRLEVLLQAMLVEVGQWIAREGEQRGHEEGARECE
jgi:hypothetical protein